MVSGLSQAEEQENEFCGRNASKQSVASLSHIGTEECLGGAPKKEENHGHKNTYQTDEIC